MMTLDKLMRPVGNHLIGEPIYQDTTEGGLALPPGVAKNPSYAPMRVKVLRVGPGYWNEDRQEYTEMEFKPGDVVYPGGPGFTWTVGGREVVLLDAASIVAVDED